MNIGRNVQRRRRRLRLTQKELAGQDLSRTYISQVENDRIRPSFEKVIEFAQKLDITVGELIGDHVTMRAAKAFVFQPDECRHFLDQLPDTETKRVLGHLAECFRLGVAPSCSLLRNPELHYIAAKVYQQQHDYESAIKTLEQGLKVADFFWRLRLYQELTQCFRTKGETEKYEGAVREMLRLLDDTDSLEDLKTRALRDAKHDDSNGQFLDILNGLEWAKALSQVLTTACGGQPR